MKVIGSRKRVWYRSSGEKERLVIRRLQCKECTKIHHELPDSLIPYRRYDVESMERVVEGNLHNDVAVDDVTIYRWSKWFVNWVIYAIGCLQSIALRFQLSVNQKSTASQSVLQKIGQFVGRGSGWLKRAVRSIANSNLWVTDPFCISVQTPLE